MVERGRRYSKEALPYWPCFSGDCSGLAVFLASKGRSPGWLPLRFIDALLRGFGQIVFANNPVSGLLLLVALIVCVPLAAVVGTITASLGLLTSVFLRQPSDLICSGVTTFNPALVGIVSTVVAPKMYGLDVMAPAVLGTIILAAITCTFLANSMGSMMGSLTHPLPMVSAPFNIIELLLLLWLRTFQATTDGLTLTSTPDLLNQTEVTQSQQIWLSNVTTDVAGNMTTGDLIDWTMVMWGSFVSMSQIFATADGLFSLLMYSAVLMFSPLTALFCVLGAVLGTLAGLCVSEPPYESVYTGEWGYNGLVVAASLGGFFLVLTWRSTLAALAGVLLCVGLQLPIAPALAKAELPFLTVPYVLGLTLLMSLTSTLESGGFHRPQRLSFPERHIAELRREIKGTELPRYR